MARRRKIGIIYDYNENWIGGTYYIQNLISALKTIAAPSIPKLYIYTEKDEHFKQLKSITKYPYLYRGGLSNAKSIFGNRIVNSIYHRILNKKPFIYLRKKLDVVFPARDETLFHPNQHFVYWIADFQEHYLPQFFPKKTIDERKGYQRSLLLYAKNIIFSSRAVQDDFNDIYPYSTLKQFVLPFAVTLPALKNATSNLEKYKINCPYFICCNQFWKHKNHFKVLEAIKILVDRGKAVHVVFTGKEHDDRNPEYFNEMNELVKALDIGANVSFLGFISREDQISLIASSTAIIQPSLFEGWSTVIEDGKSLKVNIIASELKVHIEQLKDYPSGLFFNPYDAEDLAEKMIVASVLENKISFPYNESIKRFANNFMHIIETLNH
jgi:glycosyltransferase involved in cell wall biosynthesis